MTALSVDVVVIRRPAADGILEDREIDRLVKQALAAENASGAWDVSIVLVDDDELRALHRDFMDIDEPTDVMTFPAEPDEEREAGGDIVISVERAAEQGPEHSHTTEEEVRFLILHGVLHLSGWDDRTPEERTAMLERQRVILASFPDSRG
jgi:probable rRNA maturation factor